MFGERLLNLLERDVEEAGKEEEVETKKLVEEILELSTTTTRRRAVNVKRLFNGDKSSTEESINLLIPKFL